ncbi:MAG: MFS transporter [Acidimicrobiia bacterium]|nr:MFS transporter [Acidimicrobiia bacterium]
MRSPQRAGEPAAPATPRGAFASLHVRPFPRLWAAGWVWHACRYMGIFVSSYQVNQLTGSPLLVQLVGAAFFAPMFFGGVLAGTISDRFDRKRTITRQLAVLGPAALAMGALVASERAPVWAIYLFVGAIGTGNVVDMTSRRTLVIDLVGPSLVTNVVALESLALHAGTTIGGLSGGAVIAWLGVGPVYMVIGALYLAAVGLFRVAPSQPVSPDAPARLPLRADIAAGLVLLRTHPLLRSVLGVTVLMNFFYYAFMPLVPVFAERLEVGALRAGLLASALGLGTMSGSLLVAWRQPRRRGRLYVGGPLLAMALLAAFANVSSYWPALALLMGCGLAAAGFGSTQGSIVATSTDPVVRGRAMGLLSMAIGGLPFGMLSLGLVAQRTNPALAVTVSCALGFVIVAGWQLARPAVWRLE